jgi:hypothetical protein
MGSEREIEMEKDGRVCKNDNGSWGKKAVYVASKEERGRGVDTR